MHRYQKYGFEPLDVYKWNIAISEALYPLLHIIEIGVRNRLHDEIGTLLNDREWLFNKNTQILGRLRIHWVKKIDENIFLLDKDGKLDEDHLVAELNFGFWTTLLSVLFEHQQLLWPRLKNKVFPMAHGISIANIRDRFNSIRRLRNRVFHYRSICHWKDLQDKHDMIVEAIKWIDPALLHLIKVDRFNKIYTSLTINPQIKREVPQDSTVKESLTVQIEGGREIRHFTHLYSNELDVIE